jgi:hypothetical protein
MHKPRALTTVKMEWERLDSAFISVLPTARRAMPSVTNASIWCSLPTTLSVKSFTKKRPAATSSLHCSPPGGAAPAVSKSRTISLYTSR